VKIQPVSIYWALDKKVVVLCTKYLLEGRRYITYMCPGDSQGCQFTGASSLAIVSSAPFRAPFGFTQQTTLKILLLVRLYMLVTEDKKTRLSPPLRSGVNLGPWKPLSIDSEGSILFFQKYPHVKTFIPFL
jgi:hypothetical protein